MLSKLIVGYLMMTHRQQSLPVLIVGAGPTGLTLAACLTKYGVAVRLIEKKSALSRHTKATNLMQRSQEVLWALQLLEPLNDISGCMRRIMVHAYGKCFGPSTMHLKESPFPDVLLCGQHNFEAIMSQGLAARGVTIEFKTELTSLTQADGQVIAQIVGPNGDEEVVCGYVVGCDGPAGMTRTFTKYDFRPTKTGVGLRQVDCKLVWKRLSTLEQMWLFYFDHGFAAVVPLPGGIHRVITVEPKKLIPERAPTLEEMETRLREITGDQSLLLRDAEWESYTDLSMGLAKGLRDGRILLAGDAGNPILPNGGQGMNTGIGDAFNLGWKLAYAVQHAGATALLDTYEQERHALRTALEKAQFSSLRYTILVTPRWMQFLFRHLAGPLLRWGGEYKMAQAFSQLTIHTRKSALTLERAGKKGLRAGDRALDADVCLGTKTIKLYELIYAGGWTLFAFTGIGKGIAPKAQATLDAWSRVDIAHYLVSTEANLDTSHSVLYDLDELAHRVYQVKQPILFLVRPDGHVGARVRPADLSDLEAYVEKWIPLPKV